MGPLAVRGAEDAGEAEIRELQRAVGCDEEVVGLEIPVEDPALVAVGHRLQRHGHVRFDLGRAERDELVLDDRLQVGLAALEDEVEVAFVREAVHKLDDVRVPKLLQQLDLADRREVDALPVVAQPDLFDRHNLLRERVLCLCHHAERALTEHRSLDVPLLPRLGLAGLAILTHPRLVLSLKWRLRRVRPFIRIEEPPAHSPNCDFIPRRNSFLGRVHNPSRDGRASRAGRSEMGLADDFAKVQLQAAAATKDLVQGPRLGARPVARGVVVFHPALRPFARTSLSPAFRDAPGPDTPPRR